MIGAVLLAGCSQDDVAIEVTPEEPVALNFSITEAETNYTDASTRAGQTGAMNTEDLYTTGFGAMASVTAGSPPTYDNKPNLMYNQEVEYTHVGDMEPPLTGYWSYQPVKYWPTDLTHCYISAYAPYMDPADLEGLPADATGIIGLSANSEPPYVVYRRCEQPNEVVDLLWYYKDFVNESGDTEDIPDAGILNMKMRHALARLEIKVALASDVVLDPVTTKVLIEKITLTGQMAKTGQLHLYEQETETVGEGPEAVTKYYPIWSGQTYDLDHSIQIKNVDNDDASYGIIDSQVRYIEGMPYSWQPAGLKVYNPSAPEGTDDGMRNALSTGDRTGYVYLIPQDNLELTVTVKYHKVTSGSDVPGVKTTESTLHIPPKPSEEAPYPPLKGNTRYTLNLTLSGI